jgi:hypothetical protein
MRCRNRIFIRMGGSLANGRSGWQFIGCFGISIRSSRIPRAKQSLPHNRPGFHDEAHVLDRGNVVKGIAGDGDYVGEEAGL